MIAMMIDIETLSLSPNAYVTQVGVCIANTELREYLMLPENFWVSEYQPGKMNFDTVSWWMAQDRKAAESVFKKDAERVTPKEIFETLEYHVSLYPGMTIWGSPAMFDLPILTTFFGDRKPWVYNMERDMMTLYKLIDPKGELNPPPNELAHDAASDAKWQMDYLFNLLDKLKGLQNAN